MKKILMKITSRERPEQLLRNTKAYIDKANNLDDMFWLFTFDKDDKQYNDASFTDRLAELFDFYEKIQVVICYGDRAGKIGAINANVSTLNEGHPNYELGKEWDILLNISDDQVPIRNGYDDLIRRTMPDDLDASLWFTDGQPRVNTQEIVGRKYYERFGYIYHPSYKSLWCDNETTDVAAMLGKQIKSETQIVKHYHPGWDIGTPTDALYQHNDKFWNVDEANYNKRKQNQFKDQ